MERRRVIKRAVEISGRWFFVMRSPKRLRLWEIQNSEQKVSAQLAEVKGFERDMLIQKLNLR